MKTKAAVLYEMGKELAIEELEIPELERGQVLVKVLYSGLCGSQLNEIRGRKGEDKYLPHTLGHEGSGIVIKIGTGVKGFKEGDYVVLTWLAGKGTGAPSCKYKKGSQAINSGAISTFSEYAVISENRLVKISKKIPPDIAAVLGCAVPTGVGIVKNTLKPEKGSSIAIFGVGGIGLCAVIGAAFSGCGKIIAVDIYDSKLELAKELGATHVINSRNTDPCTKIKELTNNLGVNYAVEASGVAKVMEQAYESTSTPGKVALAGNVKKGDKISIDPYPLLFGKQLLGTSLGETHRAEDIPKYAQLYLDGNLKIDKLITHKYTLSEINKAFAELESGNMGRGLVRCSEI